VRPRETEPRYSLCMGTGLTSPTHIVILLLIALLLFGAKRLPEIGRSLGHGMREFKDSISGEHHPDEPKPELPPASTLTAAAPVASADELSPEERQRMRALLDAADERDSRA
jgi:sec-independent protein translocase protein TatA